MDKITLADAIETVRGSGDTYAKLCVRGGFDAGLYKPTKSDPQSPHKRDEIYIVAGGTGTFFCDGERAPFEPGDLLFVPRGIEHRFEDFTDDFSTWVIFFGAASEG